MTDTPALLPPDPSVPGRYWLKQHWGDDVVARWNPSGRYWNTGEFSVLTAKDAAVLGCTLASPHPIPGPAALEAVWEAIASMEADRDAFRVNGQTDIYSRGKGHGLDDAIHMLRAALETKEVEA